MWPRRCCSSPRAPAATSPASSSTCAAAAASPARASDMAIRTTIDDTVAIITIDRPEAMNALDVPSQAELRSQLLTARDDDAVRVIVLTGAGNRAFCAGADL